MLMLIVGFVLGAVVMDFMWAWRLGMPQRLWYRFKHRNDYSDIEFTEGER